MSVQLSVEPTDLVGQDRPDRHRPHVATSHGRDLSAAGRQRQSTRNRPSQGHDHFCCFRFLLLLLPRLRGQADRQRVGAQLRGAVGSQAWATFWLWLGAAGVWAAIAVAYATAAGRTWATQMRQAGRWWNRPVVKAGASFLLACCLIRLWFVVVPVALITAAVLARRTSANRAGRERIRRDWHIAEMEADLGITEWQAPPQ